VSLVLLVLLFLFWMIPVTFVSGLANLQTLSQMVIFNWLVDFVNSSSWLTGLVTGLGPALVLKIFMMILPRILRAIHSIEKPFVRSESDRELLKSYYAFLFLNVFFVSVIAGSIFKSLEKMMNNAGSIPGLLAASLPGLTSFFINYIFVSLAGHFFFLSRIFGLLISRILRRFDKTREERAKRDIPAPFTMVEKMANEILIFSISITYTTQGPLINVITMIYFAISYFTTKHNIMYSLTPPYQRIRFAPTLVEITFASTVIFQLLMIGILALKYFPYAAILLAVLALTILFFLFLRYRCARAFEHPPLTELPTEIRSNKQLQAIKRDYRDPALSPPDSYILPIELVLPGDPPITNEDRIKRTKQQQSQYDTLGP